MDFVNKNSPLMCRFLGFILCTIMTFMILFKPRVCENLVLELNAKMLSANEIAGCLNFNISKTIGGLKLNISIKATD